MEVTPEQGDGAKDRRQSRRCAGKPRAWAGSTGGMGVQGRRAGRKLLSMAIKEKEREEEEGGGNSFRLPGWDYKSPPQKSPKKHFREGKTLHRNTACKSLPVAFPGGSC